MTNGSPLSRRLADLAGSAPEFDGAARILSKSGATIEHILDAIDATVLPSALTFDSGPARITLHVAGRRLHMICDADGSVAAPDGLLGTALALENDVLREQAVAVLQDFVNNATMMAMVAEASTVIDGDAPDSISVGSLQEACGLDVLEDDHLPKVDRLLARSGASLTAWIRLNGNRLEDTFGPVAEISGLKIALTTQLARFEKTRLDTCASHDDPSLTCFLDAANAGQSLGIATFEDGKLLFTVPTREFSHVFRAFSRIL